MKLEVIAGDITQQNVGAIVVNIFEGVTTPQGATGVVDVALDGIISKLIAEGEITGKLHQVTVIHTLGKMLPSRVLVVGLGPKTDFTLDTARSAIAESCRHLHKLGVKSISTIVHGAGIGGLDDEQAGQTMAEGIILGTYKFDKYKSAKGNTESENVNIVENDSKKMTAINKGVFKGTVIAESVNICRDMANEPANSLTPTQMTEVALLAARESDLGLQIMEKPEMEKLGMGAFLGVAQGSIEPPKMIILRFTGDPDNSTNNLALLGKGITFDTGGLDIKSTSGMATMKGDMAGGASVIAAMRAIGILKPKINVIGIIPATENMPGGKAQRPGDVVRAMNGTTIEIDNTDAEGRLVLADAASYARSLGINRIIDVATLTGAVVVALGKICTAILGNEQELIDQVVSAGTNVGERIWQLPSYKEYKDQYKSDIADIKNTGGRGAGTITGAQFIGEFTQGASWAHLDIAGTSSTEKNSGYNPKGATGIPVRTLVELTCNMASD
jgi:leucyl aminopeptidase